VLGAPAVVERLRNPPQVVVDVLLDAAFVVRVDPSLAAADEPDAPPPLL
jgi:hypothetical protein